MAVKGKRIILEALDPIRARDGEGNLIDLLQIDSLGALGGKVADELADKASAVDVTDLQSRMTSAESELVSVSLSLSEKLDTSLKGVPNGVAELDADGKIFVEQLPDIALTQYSEVADEAEMLALEAQQGDFAKRADNSKTYMLSGSDPSVLADWKEIGSTFDASGLQGEIDTLEGRVDVLEAEGLSIAQVKVVSKGGDDASGDGSLKKPFATIEAAMSSITDASPSKRYVVKVESGAYTESALTLKANVFIVGDVKEAVRITATSYALDSSFSGSADNRSGMARVILNGACNFDWGAVTSAAGKLYMTEVSFSDDVSVTGHNNAIAQAQFDSCIFFGNFSVSGINVGVFKNNTCFGNISLNQHPSGGMATILNAAGGYCSGAVTLTTTVSDFNRRCALFAHSFYMSAITVDGPSSYADMTDSSIPSAGPTALNGGNVVYINKQQANNTLSNLAYPTAVNQPILPATTNATNMGDWGKQWFYNFAYVHASSGTDLYLTSVMENYDAAGDTSGKSIWIQADGYGLQENVNGGDVIVETSAVSGTGVRGKIKLSAREIDADSSKIIGVADATEASHAVNKGQLDLKIDATEKGAASGVAELDETGKVPASQLPSLQYVQSVKMPAMTLSAGDVANGYIDLADEAMSGSIHVFCDRLAILEGLDYSVSVVGGVSRLTWIGPSLAGAEEEFSEGDVIYVQYLKS